MTYIQNDEQVPNKNYHNQPNKFDCQINSSGQQIIKLEYLVKTCNSRN